VLLVCFSVYAYFACRLFVVLKFSVLVGNSVGGFWCFYLLCCFMCLLVYVGFLVALGLRCVCFGFAGCYGAGFGFVFTCLGVWSVILNWLCSLCSCLCWVWFVLFARAIVCFCGLVICYLYCIICC